MKILKKLKGEKPNLQSTRMRYGSYRYAIIAVVLAILVVMNLAVNQLPSSFLNIDLSSSSYYSIGEMTKSIVGNLEQDVSIYVLCDESEKDSIVDEMLKRYAQLSDHISISYVDTAVNPGFLEDYHATDAEEGSLVVVSDLRSTVVDYDDLYEVEYDYYTYYTTGTLSYTQSYDGEQLVTSAIDYVVSETLPILYVLTGHSEMSLSSDITSQIQSLNIEVQELNLLTAEDGVPEDAGALLIYGPSLDLSADETEMILEYMEAGGSVMIIPQLTTTEMANLDSLLDAYGLSLNNLLVLEGNSSYYYQSPVQLLPSIQSHTITSPIISADLSILVYEPQGIVISEDVRSTLSMTTLVTTSDDAYGKDISSGQISTISKESSDEEGPFVLAVAVTEEVGEEETQLVVISCQYLLASDIIDYFSVGNVDLFLNSLSWMCDHESTISISAKSLDTATISLTSSQINFWRTLSMYVVPGGLLICGVVIFFARRRK